MRHLKTTSTEASLSLCFLPVNGTKLDTLAAFARDVSALRASYASASHEYSKLT